MGLNKLSKFRDLSKRDGRSWLRKFYKTLKHKYPNFYAMYLTTRVVFIWSGFWYLIDCWATGQNFLTAGTCFSLPLLVKHFILLTVGMCMLYIDDSSLQELLDMKPTPPRAYDSVSNKIEHLFIYFKNQYPNIIEIYTMMGIILSWFGIWGLIYDFPLHPLLRSLLTLILGILLLYVDNLKLDEL